VQHITIDSLARLLQDISALVQIKRDELGGGAPPVPGERMAPLDSTFISSLPKGLFSFRATADAIVTSDTQPIMRRACPKQPSGSCGASVREDNGLFRCPKCEKAYETFTYAFLLHLQVVDHTGACTVTLFDTDVQQYITHGLKAKVGGTCACALASANPFPPFTPQDVLSAARAALDA
jgi:hypothetical protein